VGAAEVSRRLIAAKRLARQLAEIISALAPAE
jgi:hypothetical protein